MAFNHDKHDDSHVGLRNAVLYLLKKEEYRAQLHKNDYILNRISDLIARIEPSLFVYNTDTPAPPPESPPADLRKLTARVDCMLEVTEFLIRRLKQHDEHFPRAGLVYEGYERILAKNRAPKAEPPECPDKVQGRIRVYREVDKELRVEHDSIIDFPIKSDIRIGEQHLIIGVELVDAKLTVYRCPCCGEVQGEHGPVTCPTCNKSMMKYRLEEVTEAC